MQWLDQIGADIPFTEHHFVEDGYLPSWVPAAAAMASVTHHVRFGTDIADAVQSPDSLGWFAVPDNPSGGRVIWAGYGYAPHKLWFPTRP